MSDRLSELVRQRALVLEHLAWLDREIAHANMAAPGLAPTPPLQPPAPPSPLPPPLPSPGVPGDLPAAAPTLTNTSSIAPAPVRAPLAPVTIPGLPAPKTAAAALPDVGDEVLEQYRVSPTTVHQDVRKGCLLYFAGAFVVLGIVVAILYFTISSR